MKLRIFALVFAVAALGWASLPALADETGDAGEKACRLTDEQREQVRNLVQQAHADIQALREELRAAVQKLRELRQEGAGEDALKAQVEVVKSKGQALRARVEKLQSDLKAAVPADVYSRMQQRFRARVHQFMENHPRLKEQWERRRQHCKTRRSASEE